MERPLIDLRRLNPESSDLLIDTVDQACLCLAWALQEATTAIRGRSASENDQSEPNIISEECERQMELLKVFLQATGLDTEDWQMNDLIEDLRVFLIQLEAEIPQSHRRNLGPVRGALWFLENVEGWEATAILQSLAGVVGASRGWWNALTALAVDDSGLQWNPPKLEVSEGLLAEIKDYRASQLAASKIEHQANEFTLGELTQVGVGLAHSGRTASAEEVFVIGASLGEPAAAENLGLILQQQGQHGRDIEVIYRGAICAGSISALVLLAGLLEDDAQQAADVEQLYRLALEAESTVASFGLGRLLAHQEGRESEAIRLLRSAVPEYDPEASFLLGNLLARQPLEHSAAVQAFEQAAEAGDPQAYLPLATLLGQLPGREHEASTALLNAIAAGIEDAHTHLAVHRFNSGELDQAERHFREAYYAKATDAAYNLGLFFARTDRDPELAEKYLREALGNGSAKAANDLGILLMRSQEEWQEAIELFRKAISAGRVGAYNNLGLLLMRMRQYEAAREAFEAAITAGVREAYGNLANLLAILEPRQEATIEKLFLVAIKAGDESAWRNLGLFLQSQEGREKDAVDAFRRAARAGDLVAFRDLGNLLLDSEGDPAAAERAFREGIAAGDLDSYTNLALLLEMTQRVDEAEATWRQAMTLNVEFARYNLASFLALHPRPHGSEEAEELYRREMAGGDASAFNSLAVLMLNRGGSVVEAEALLVEAERLGDQLARDNLTELRARLARVRTSSLLEAAANPWGMTQATWKRRDERSVVSGSPTLGFIGYETLAAPHTWSAPMKQQHPLGATANSV